MSNQSAIIKAIDESPLNRGLRGVDWIANPENVALRLGDNIALFDAEDDGIFQVHFLFNSPGREALRFARETFRKMFVEYGAKLIFGLVPEFLRQAKIFARWAGGKLVGVRDTPHGPCELYVLSKDMWKGEIL